MPDRTGNEVMTGAVSSARRMQQGGVMDDEHRRQHGLDAFAYNQPGGDTFIRG
jgi:hypothetical protein